MSIFLGNKYCRVLVVVCKRHSTQIGLSRRIELGMPFTSKERIRSSQFGWEGAGVFAIGIIQKPTVFRD
jgi:hypothetical protein